MELKERIAAAKQRLSHVQTTVRDESGASWLEEGGSRIAELEKGAGFVVDSKPDLQLCQVAPGIFIGSQDVAAELPLLSTEGITGVVNAAFGVANHFPDSFRYLSLPLLDQPDTDIRPVLERAREFVEREVQRGGKVLIHCNAGYSRAPTIALAILISRGESLDSAIARIRQSRPVKPNDGFMRQLRDLEKTGI